MAHCISKKECEEEKRISSSDVSVARSLTAINGRAVLGSQRSLLQNILV